MLIPILNKLNNVIESQKTDNIYERPHVFYILYAESLTSTFATSSEKPFWVGHATIMKRFKEDVLGFFFVYLSMGIEHNKQILLVA